MTREHNKLVRGRIPEIIANNGGESITRRIDDDREFIRELAKKLIEEANELLITPTIEEMADVAEVTKALQKALGFSDQELSEARRKKVITNGDFEDRIFLISSEG
jgi:predicted house-cleaning noncanonical NTP pyrophosphatase (MazG superfamily)